MQYTQRKLHRSVTEIRRSWSGLDRVSRSVVVTGKSMRPRRIAPAGPRVGRCGYGATFAKMTVALPRAVLVAVSRTETLARRNRPVPAATPAVPVAVKV